MWRFISTTLIALVTSTAFASDCPEGDRLLQNKSSLASLCPDGFSSSPPRGDIAQQMEAQPDNVKMVVAAAQNAGVPPDLALAVSYHESVGFNSCAGSPTGVRGPMQLTQKTGRAYGFDRDINEENIQGGMAVLKAAYVICGESNHACLAKYYNGSNAAEQAQWARRVGAAHYQLKTNPAQVASACNMATTCRMGPGDFPNAGTGGAQLASVTPPPSGHDIYVGTGQV